MNPERWQRVESLVRAAMERPAAERPDFLARGCAGDEELRRRAASLLSFRVRAEAEDSAGGAPGEADGGLPTAARAETLAGNMLGRYRIERELGRGGMGEVYLACGHRWRQTPSD